MVVFIGRVSNQSAAAVWEHQANLDRDIRIRGLGQTQREEISIKTGKVGMTREEDPIIEDIIGVTMIDKETFHEI